MDKRFEKQVDRNLKGKELEKEGKIEEAIKLYEANLQEGFDGSLPYERLSILYKKQNKINDQIRVLQEAVKVFTKVAYGGRADGLAKLKTFTEKLEKALASK